MILNDKNSRSEKSEQIYRTIFRKNKKSFERLIKIIQ